MVAGWRRRRCGPVWAVFSLRRHARPGSCLMRRPRMPLRESEQSRARALHHSPPTIWHPYGLAATGMRRIAFLPYPAHRWVVFFFCLCSGRFSRTPLCTILVRSPGATASSATGSNDLSSDAGGVFAARTSAEQAPQRIEKYIY